MNYLPPLRTLSRIGNQVERLARRPLRWAGGLITTALPQQCALCAGYAGRWPVCRQCEEQLPRLPHRRCPQCADISESGDVCARCLAHPRSFETAVAAFVYTDPIDRLIQTLKYGHRLHLAAWFGQRLAERFADPSTPGPGMVVAVPLHPDRLRERGFNQATEIARPLARFLGFPLCHDLCFRIRPTPPQTRLTQTERHHNVDQAFECRSSLAGQTVVIVDDVITSTASINELARVLKLHGAGRIVAAAAARTLHT